MNNPSSFLRNNISVLFVSFCFLTLLWALGYALLSSQKELFLQTYREELQQITRSEANELSYWLEHQKQDAMIQANTPAFRQLVNRYFATHNNDIKEEILSHLRSLQKEKGFEGVSLVAPHHQEVISSLPVRKLDVQQNFIQKTVESQSPQLRDFHKNPETNISHLDLYVPITERNSTPPSVSGILLLELPVFEKTAFFLNSHKQKETAEVLLLERHDDAVLFLNNTRFNKESSLNLRIPLSRSETLSAGIISGNIREDHVTDYRGKEVIFASAPVQNSPWVLVNKVDKEELERSFTAQSQKIFPAILLTTLFFPAALFFFWRKREKMAETRLLLQKETEKKLKNHCSFLMKHSREIILLLDSRFHILEGNPEALKQYGFSQDDLKKHNVTELFPPQERGSFLRFINQMTVGQEITRETMHQRKGGDCFPVKESIMKFEKEGEVFYQHIINNISQQKDVEEKLKKTRRSLSVTHSINHALLFSRTQEELLEKVCKVMVDDAGFVSAWGGFGSKETKPVYVASYPSVTTGNQEYDNTGNEMAFRAFRWGRVAQSRLAHHHDPSYTITPHNRDKPQKEPQQISSIGAFPLKDKDVSFGVLVLFSYSHNAFTGEELSFLMQIIDNISHALLALKLREMFSHTKEKLEESEQRYHILFQRLNDAIFIFNIDENSQPTNFIECNEVACRMLGYQEEELLRIKPKEIEPSNETGKVLDMLLMAHHALYETFYITRMGLRLPVEVSAHYVNFKQEKVVIAIARDISKRKEAEEEQARLSMAIEKAAEAILITDENGIIQYINPAFENISGYTFFETIGQTPNILKSDQHPPEFFKEMWNTISSGKVWRGHFINKRKDGTLYEEEASISPILNDDGRIFNYVAVKRDISKERSLERQVHQSQKLEAIGTLAGGISHDFNNILAGMLGYAELIRIRCEEGEGEHQDPKLKHDIASIIRGGQRAKELIRQILTFSRKSSDAMEFIKIENILEEVMNFIHSTLPATITVHTHINRTEGVVYGNPTQLHQVFMNLCTNAMQAMEQGGTLEVNLEYFKADQNFLSSYIDAKSVSYVKITVKDSGEGIPQEIQDKIFDPFFTTKESGKGTGLGLAVVHGIVKDHEGIISLESKKGEGTTFTLYFPLQAEGNEKEGVKRKTEQLPRGDEPLILIDDEEDILATTSAFLSHLGYGISSFCNAEEAYNEIKSHPERYRLIISDQTLPGMTGTMLATELNKIAPQLPVLICSGLERSISDSLDEEVTIAGTLSKPVDPATLAHTIRTILDEKRRDAL